MFLNLCEFCGRLGTWIYKVLIKKFYERLTKKVSIKISTNVVKNKVPLCDHKCSYIF